MRVWEWLRRSDRERRERILGLAAEAHAARVRADHVSQRISRYREAALQTLRAQTDLDRLNGGHRHSP